jgi:hypothetical protein
MLRLATLSAVLGTIALFAVPYAGADVYVKGHTRSNGTYVAPHYRSDPDSSVNNNWSTRGNMNPHTGEWGTRTPSPTGYGGSGSGPMYVAPYSPSASVSAYPIVSNPYVAVPPRQPGSTAPVITSPPPATRAAPVAARRTIEDMISMLEQAKTVERLKLAKDFAATESAVSWTELAMRIHLAEMIRARGKECNWRDFAAVSDLMDILILIDAKAQTPTNQ